MTDNMDQWIIDLALALGYKLGHGHPATELRAIDLTTRPFAFIKPTPDDLQSFVVIYEVDGQEGQHGIRNSRPRFVGSPEIAVRTRRVPLPNSFELVNVTADDNTEHFIALKKVTPTEFKNWPNT